MGRLCEVLAEPLRDPLAAEQFVVQNTGLALWLNLRLAERFGIAGNHELSLPASFVWRLFRQFLGQVPETNPFDKGVLVWRVYQRLPVIPWERGIRAAESLSGGRRHRSQALPTRLSHR